MVPTFQNAHSGPTDLSPKNHNLRVAVNQLVMHSLNYGLQPTTTWNMPQGALVIFA